MAEEYKLFPVYKEEFHQVYAEHQNHPEFGPLMLRMKVVNVNGESAMDDDQWDAASVSFFPVLVPDRITLICGLPSPF